MNEEQRAAAARLAEFERLPRKLLDIACRVRANECLFHDDEFIDDASHALKEALDLLRELAAGPVQEATPDDMKVYDAIAANYAAPQQQAEPVQDIQKALKDAQHTADFYRRRCEALQQWQSRMRDPERTVVCDILANGFTLDPPIPHNRYALPAEPVQEPVGWLNDIDGEFEHSHKPWMDNPSEEWHPVYAAPQQPMRCPTDGGECGAGGYCRPEQRKPLKTAMEAEIECDCLVAWNASTYGHSAHDTVHPMFLSAFIRGYRAAERAHGITGEQE